MALVAVPLTLLGCAHRTTTTPNRGIVVTMTRLTVTPTPENNPATQWDQGEQDSGGGEGCGLLLALDFVAAPLGSVATSVCALSTSGRKGGQRKAEDPDLFVAFSLGSTFYRSPVISDRASHDRTYSLFIPNDAFRDDALRVAVYDLDGDDEREATLIADHELGAGSSTAGSS
ncbi:MAG: hypothetical protein HC927_01985, partial [Deltaproteobacteria bacterium]|nr:hypothetical protein [Deltaproteobacteria bacterium]